MTSEPGNGEATAGATPPKGSPIPESTFGRRTARLSELSVARDRQQPSQLEAIFERCVAAIIASHGISVSAPAFEYILVLAVAQMQRLFGQIHKFSTVQRRLHPSVSDLRCAMDSFGLRITDLEQQMYMSSPATDALNRIRIESEYEPVLPHSEAFFRSQISDLDKLVPSGKKRGAHIPAWMPKLPPDHTFMSTGRYVTRISEPRQLREKLVEEGRLAEAALRRLGGVVKVDEADLAYEPLKETGPIDRAQTEVETGAEIGAETGAEEDSGFDEYADLSEPLKSEDVVDAAEGTIDGADGAKADGALSSTEQHGAGGMEIDGSDTMAEFDGSASVTEPNDTPKRPLSLKLSLGGTRKQITIRADPDPAASDVTAPPARRDVLAYVTERQRQTKRRRQQPVVGGQLVDVAEPSVVEDTGVSGPEAIEQAFRRVFAGLQKSHDASRVPVAETGLVMWDLERYNV